MTADADAFGTAWLGDGLVPVSSATAPQGQQVRYGENFATEVNRSVSGNMKRFAGDPMMVVDAMIHAVTAVSPQRRYFVGHDTHILLSVRQSHHIEHMLLFQHHTLAHHRGREGDRVRTVDATPVSGVR